jgi:hypothetical protein
MDDQQRKFAIQSKRCRAAPSLACGYLTYLLYFQAVFMNATPKFLHINMPCHYYPDLHLLMLPMSTIWQRRDSGATRCSITSLTTTSSNQSLASQRQSYPSHLHGTHPSRSQTLIQHSIPSRSPFLFVPKSPGTQKILSAPLSTFGICADYRPTSTIVFPCLSQKVLSVHWRARWN